MSQKKIACIAIVASLFCSGVASASGLQDMWNSNITAAGNIDSKNRHGFYGGSATFRTPIKSVTLFNYSPPRVSAGCAGADIYMGSFSYINKDQIVSTLKAVMNNAQGLLFQAAIEFVSPMISGLMKDFSKKMEELNSMNMNSCQIATSMMGDTVKQAGAAGERMAQYLSSKGQIDDRAQAQAAPSEISASKAKDAEKDLEWAGNVIWKALKNAQAEEKLDMNMFPVPADATAAKKYKREVLLSFIGTQISTTSTSSETDGKNIADIKVTNIDPKFDYLSLWRSSGGEEKIICPSSAIDPNDECKNTTDKEDLKFIDADTYVDIMMYGDPAWLSNPATAKTKIKDSALFTATLHGGAIGVHPKSLAAVIAGADGTGKSLTATQRVFLEKSGVPLVKYIKELRGADELTNIKYLSDLIKGVMTLEVSISFAQAFEKAISDFQNESTKATAKDNGKTVVELPKHIKDRLETLRLQKEYLIKLKEDHNDDVKAAQDFINMIMESRDNRLTASRR